MDEQGRKDLEAADQLLLTLMTSDEIRNQLMNARGLQTTGFDILKRARLHLVMRQEGHFPILPGASTVALYYGDQCWIIPRERKGR